MYKVCNKCKKDKPLIEFYSYKTGTRAGKPLANCITCITEIAATPDYKELRRKYREANKARLSAQRKQYYEKNKSHESKIRELWLNKNQESLKLKAKLYRIANKAKFTDKDRAYYTANTKDISERHKRYYLKNRELLLAKSKQWRSSNKEKVAEYDKKYKQLRSTTDPMFKCRAVVRSLINGAAKRMGYKKNTKTEQILGCSFDKFKIYTEKQFKPGMTWLNHGKWHIDHKIPLCTAKNELEVLKLNHYTNLQPLWAEENLAKIAQDKKMKQECLAEIAANMHLYGSIKPAQILRIYDNNN